MDMSAVESHGCSVDGVESALQGVFAANAYGQERRELGLHAFRHVFRKAMDGMGDLGFARQACFIRGDASGRGGVRLMSGHRLRDAVELADDFLLGRGFSWFA